MTCAGISFRVTPGGVRAAAAVMEATDDAAG